MTQATRSPQFGLSLVIPCYNESANLPLLVERVHQAFRSFPPEKFELILVENGSKDDSFHSMQALAKLHAFIRVHRIEKNQGYGHGVFQGLLQAKQDLVAYTHADLQCDPGDVLNAYRQFLQHLSDGGHYLIRGKRQGRPLSAWLFSRFFEVIGLLLLSRWIYEINAQPKLFHRKLLAQLLEPPVDFTFDLYLLLEARRMGWKSASVPVLFPDRKHGVSNWAGSFRSKLRTVLTYIRFMLRYRRRHF